MEQFLKVLTEFEALGGTGIVYGGCLRDTLTGRGPIKDIDIAVENTAANSTAIQDFIQAVEGTAAAVQHIGYGNFPDVFKSVQVERPDHPTVNFVVLGSDFPYTKRDVAQRCDFGICQVALDKDGLLRTEAFEKDLRNYTFTYTREPFDEAQYDRSLRRWERLRERYEGWVMRVPAFEHPKIRGFEPDMILLDEIG